MEWMPNITEFFVKSGLTRWPLLICSIIGSTIILERSYYFLRLRSNYTNFIKKLFFLLKKQSNKEAIAFCQKQATPIAHIAALYLKNIDNHLRESILSREATFAIEKVEQWLRGLATITHVAPLLGLLGTVAGLVTAFHEIELTSGQVQAQSLAGGIWEALLSTVFGLIVAIPCMIAYHGFESRADRIVRRMEAIVSELDEFFGNKTKKDFKITTEEVDNTATIESA
ncbi:MotA/TolQ/ExbB proton channel family protein [hydrothermal vent metagenome]|uniref:MotA/TolQ/ExbB proton channel family protein n=1 Tax=hydrothermal vent metagenome TaxID=652676 RepID=A0A3B1CW63_9ZZZZ